MEVNEILAREMWVLGIAASPERSRGYWDKNMAINGQEWRERANRLRLALAAEGIFVMRSRDA